MLYSISMSDTDEKILDALTSLTKQVDQLATGQREIRATQQEQGKDIKSLKEDISTLKTGQEALKEDVSKLKKDVNTLKGDVATLKEDVTSLKKGQETLTL